MDGLAGHGHETVVFLDEGAKELVGFATSLDHDVVVSHLLEKLVANQAVAAGQQDALAVAGRLGLRSLLLGLKEVSVDNRSHLNEFGRRALNRDEVTL